ncbi:hypothetical protein caldi_28600 [Caldinitratiruptor microaerophilus]|uniref:Uncharacterized protein n=1 Tax=Caldinitratiruptor microaerophilus TaxID=671077 RepID=A0AA35CLY6_9FIRM|nr:hypothetical protein caldi_28600 [Caldinitratiruptor microaerophilus]
MLGVVLGITFGAAAGFLENALLFRAMDRVRRAGKEPVRILGGMFFARYVFDILLLVLFWVLTRSASGLIAAALSLTVAVKISLFIVYTRKGGRFD